MNEMGNKTRGNDVRLVELHEVYSQEDDCCSLGDAGQNIAVTAVDGGGGHYLVLETERWAIDDVDAFAAMLKLVLARCEPS